MYFVSIDAGAQVNIILLASGPCMVIVNLLGQVCTLGRAPRTKETLPDFHEWCRVTRHPRIFRGLTGCQRTPGFWGVTNLAHIFSSQLLTSSTQLDVGIGLKRAKTGQNLKKIILKLVIYLILSFFK